jgi:hypothetical protein
VRGDAEIGDVAAAGEFLPALGDGEVDSAHLALLRQQRGIGRLPKLDRGGAVGQRVTGEKTDS